MIDTTELHRYIINIYRERGRVPAGCENVGASQQLAWHL